MTTKKDARADIRINRIIKECLKNMDMTPQKIVDNYIKRNLKKILSYKGGKK